MTPPDPIRPGSALTDPNLRAALAERLPQLEAAAAVRGRGRTSGLGARESLEEALNTWSLLAAYPWRRLNYRFGRWQSEPILWKALITFEIWESYHWERTEDSFQLLDPYTGDRLGEFYSQTELRRIPWRKHTTEPEVLIQPGGALEFVGEPGAIGAYRPLGGGPDTIRYSWCPWLHSGVLGKGIEALRTGALDRLPPPYMFIDLDLLDKYRVWFVDEPNKPQRKAPWAYEARTYRPGGPPRFGRTKHG